MPFEGQYYESVGRRKEATARVRLFQGDGAIVVNGKPVDEYFGRDVDVVAVKAPLLSLEVEGTFDVSVKVKGGGITGQASAVQLGVARALLKIDESNRKKLREDSLLTRDARIKERKKPGLKRARKAPQYTKR
jgi:small subunit ribosomal protein S9